MQKVKLESLVKQFQNNNEDFRRIKELVEQGIEQSLTNHRHILKIAFLSVIDSCRRESGKIQCSLLQFVTNCNFRRRDWRNLNRIDQYNYELSTNEQLCCEHKNANEVTYWRFLVDEAEKFFNERLNELEQVCINRLTDVFTSVSIPSQLTKKSGLDLDVVSSMQLYGNKSDQSAHSSGYNNTL